MSQVTIGPKYQVVIPKEVRKKVQIGVGKKVDVRSLDDSRIIIEVRRKSLTESLIGMGKEMWDAVGGADVYIEKERQSWGEG